MGRLVQLSRANSRDLEGSTGGEGRKEGRGVLKRMEEEKGRRVLIIGRMFLVSNNQEKERKRKRKIGVVYRPLK